MCHRIQFHLIINFYQYKMTQYNSLNVKLSNSQLNKLKPAIEDGAEVVLSLLSNMVGGSDDKIKIFYMSYY